MTGVLVGIPVIKAITSYGNKTRAPSMATRTQPDELWVSYVRSGFKV